MQRSLVTGADEDEGLYEEANLAEEQVDEAVAGEEQVDEAIAGEEQVEALGHQATKEGGDIPMCKKGKTNQEKLKGSLSFS